MCFPASCLSVHFSPVSACQLPGSGLCLRSQNMGGLFSSFGAGQVKVEGKTVPACISIGLTVSMNP